MDQLIKITQNENNEQVVSGRELHDFLEVGTAYKDWFPRMVKYGFVENIDFVSIAQKRATAQGNQTEYIDHALKMDMAKEISMIQRTEKGRQARRYFIACERKLKSQKTPMTLDQQIAAIATGYGSVKEELVEVKEQVADLTERFGLPATNASILKNTRNIHILRFLGGKEAKAYHDLGRKVFSEFGRDFKDNFGVPRYDAIPLSQFDEAIAYTKSWQPSYNTMIAIRNTNMQMELD